ncbi:hypothetical protein GUJ93_ZPchr0005g15498 [Zizania palustris]|uniref:Uncharacterized protein n=1 Tax=Zizania palustris TaxID=103762 RepID=A0A8J5SNX6_ZIZPA|nr:hypothetical protein GUJ93_ZPchr0005g15498 [Zizania palustris]
MLEELNELSGKERVKFKALKKDHESLTAKYEELKTSHMMLLVSHEKLEEAHEALIASTLIKPKVDIGVTCDIFDDACLNVENCIPTKTSISTSCDDLLAMPCSSTLDIASCSTNISS